MLFPYSSPADTSTLLLNFPVVKHCDDFNITKMRFMFFILYFSITVYYSCLRITTKLTEKYVVSQNSEYNFLHVKR